MAIAIYSYDARPPVEGRADVERVLYRSALRYRNALVEASRRLDETMRLTVRAACPLDLIAAATRASFFVCGWVRLANKLRSAKGREERGRGRSPIADRVERARAHERAAHAPLWAAERSARQKAEVRAAIAALRADYAAEVRALRTDEKYGGSGTWPSRGLTEGAHKAALESVEKRRYGKDGRPADPTARPAFQRERDSARVGGQPGTSGVSVAEAMAGMNAYLRVQLLEPQPVVATRGKNAGKTMPSRGPTSRRAGSRRAVVWLRVDSQNRDPVWAKIPIVLDRPLPLEGRIVYAWLLRRYVGPRATWAVQFTVRWTAAVEPLPAEPSTVAVNLGWRRLADGAIRVGYAVGSDGREQEIRVPGDIEQAMEHADSIRAIRARDEIVSHLVAFAATDAAPTALRRAIVGARQWRSAERVHDIARRWGGEPKGAEGELVATLRAWARQDRHLGFWEADERAKAVRRRAQQPRTAGRPGYRVVAAALAREYDRCVVTDMDLRDVAESAPPEHGSQSEGSAQRRQRAIAAPSELRRFLKESFGRKGAARFVEAKAAWVTRSCPTCGVVADDDDPQFSQSITVRCTACNAERDQDASHGRILLARTARGEVTFDCGEPLAPSENSTDPNPACGGGGRWRRKRSQTPPEVPVPPTVSG